MTAAAPAIKHHKRLRTFIKAALWVLLATVIILAAVAIWIWSNRYDLIERQAITYLESMGVQAELDIRHANGTSADVRNIQLSHNSETFLTVDRLQASYQWRDLLDGKVEGLTFTGLEAVITIDETGQIIDGWRPPSGGGETALPPNGIIVERGALRLRTPHGEIPVRGDARIMTVDQFRFEGAIGETILRRDGVEVVLSGPVEVRREGGPMAVEAPETRLTLRHPAGSIVGTTLGVSGNYDPQTQAASGDIQVRGGRFEADASVGGQIDRLDADLRWQSGTLEAEIDAAIDDFTITDTERRTDLARTLSLADALSEVPVAENFAPSLVAPVMDLLTRSDVNAALSLYWDDQTRSVRLRAPMRVRGNKAVAEFGPLEDKPFYSYVNNSGVYEIGTNVQVNRPLPITLAPLNIAIRSDDGFTVDGLASADGQVKTGTSWRAQTANGRAARLAPLSVIFDYVSPVAEPSRLTLRGKADYDGDIPGGYVTGLIAGGTLTTTLDEGRTQVRFSPNRPLSFASLETTSDWTVEDFKAVLQPRQPLYDRREGRPAAIRTGLSQALFKARRPESMEAEEAVLDLQLGSAELAGTISDRRQDWSVDFEDLALQSETFPVIGTDLVLPSGNLTVALSDSASSAFTLTTPDSVLKTPLYAVRGMALEASGTAEDYSMTFEGGRVRIIPATEDAVPLPVMPASGTLSFANGIFTGEARTALPRAPDSPFSIDYRMDESGGTANVAIRALRFRPGQLQPQELAPALRGKIAEVNGLIDADLRIRFGGDEPMNGTGMVTIYDTSLGTAPGPVSGLSGRVELTSLFPVVTAPDQILNIASFNPGFPLENGRLTYALVPEGVSISEALFPFGEGQVSFDPFTWIYGAEENRVVLRVSGVEVGEFLQDVGDGRLAVSGVIQGTIPVVVRGIDVLVEKGRLEVPSGGTIRYTPENTPAALSESPAGTAFKALEDFKYQALFMEIDGPLDGDMLLGLDFTGTNEDVFFGVPFAFGITVEGELFNIAQSLNPNGLQQRVISTVTTRRLDETEAPD